MLDSKDFKPFLQETSKSLNDLKEVLGFKKTKKELEKLEKLTIQKDFWANIQENNQIFKKTNYLKSKISNFEKLIQTYNDIKTLIMLFEEEQDELLLKEAEKELIKLQKNIEKERIAVMLNGKFDNKNAILTLHAGAGGTEAQDWVQMLFRMYSKFCQKQKFEITVLDLLYGEEAGIKSISFIVKGTNAYGYLKGENGVHRLVRISPFDTSGRRHTSFASVEVIPELDNDTNVVISPDDLKMDVFRASGAGGQHVNKTSSAVRLTHIPTGIVASCQNERSQRQNREVALRMIKSKLVKIKEKENLEKIEDIKGEEKEISWGSQIRSYTFMPYTLVRDHITSYETGNINAVMDGEIEEIINAYLKKTQE
ncbi:MAG: peptide chain release factor 2 [Oscillospiraceae bacterium]|nr:peptide chain release factor 2 [Oscillospiraceae bacterium]